MNFKIGDRVAIYENNLHFNDYRETGEVAEIHDELISVNLDRFPETYYAITAHKKQCRRLIKKRNSDEKITKK